MLVYKFGGSSLKSADGIKKLGHLVQTCPGNLVIVVSALGKTTNALEKLCTKSWDQGRLSWEDFSKIKVFHEGITDDLLPGHTEMKRLLANDFDTLQHSIKPEQFNDFDIFYDQVVSWGEILSSKIIHAYLEQLGLSVQWLDIMHLIATDNNFRNARVDWERTQEQVNRVMDFVKTRAYLTQGFLGGTIHSQRTTLGREGSDFTAAILGNILGAEKVVIWKDVPGVMNADPQFFENPELLPEISYQEAIELAFFGAKVIHPKTIKPLQNKNIPLVVQSIIQPEAAGTLIRTDRIPDLKIPSYIFKKNQLLISISPRDFSFAVDDRLGDIFSILNHHKIRVNIVQNSAISLTVCVDQDHRKMDGLLHSLEKEYWVYYNADVELITIRHYTSEAIKRVLHGEVLIEQRTRTNAHYVVRPG